MRIAVIGATGAVGTQLVRLLHESSLPTDDLIVSASPNRAGQGYPFKERTLTLEPTGPDLFDKVDLAFFAARTDISRELIPVAVEKGCMVVDNSSVYRQDPTVPLVVPELNPEAADLARESRIVANPNCTTAILLTAIAPIHRAVGVKAIIAASYQAVSGSGSRGIAELEAQSQMIASGNHEVTPSVYPHQIAFNILPHVDSFEPEHGGYSREEIKLRDESRKILGAPDLKVSATCVRVPTYRAHCVAASLQLGADIDPDKARELCAAAPGVQVVDDPANNQYPLPLNLSGQHDVAIGRIRRDHVFDPGLAVWVAGDQLLKGAALNALQIGELLVERGLVGAR